MIRHVQTLLQALRPAFSRQAAFGWFVVVFTGFVMRADVYGVSSIIRALDLMPSCYPSLLHFFHSNAWKAEVLFIHWQRWLTCRPVVTRVEGRIVIMGDHTKQPKDARRMPCVSTLHQDSETSSKPSYFRGHFWGCLALLGEAPAKSFALPLWAEIHPEASPDSRATRMVREAGRISARLQESAFLVLDAFFAVGPVFKTAAQFGGQLHILTRAKKNIVAFQPPGARKRKQHGRPKVYGKKLKLFKLFDSRARKFQTTEAIIYRRKETVRYLTLDLIWKPVRGVLRFFLIETSRGQIILMSSDLNMEVMVALRLYTARVSIESLFASLKNLLGGLAYHFWSKYLAPTSRRPIKSSANLPASSRPRQTNITLEAIHKFVATQLIVLGTLQLLAAHHADDIRQHAHCWLRTPCGDVPSEFVTRAALINMLRDNINAFAKKRITRFILRRQTTPQNIHGVLIDKQGKAA